MARIRCIKPEFWTSESVGRLSRDSRLLFIALWNLADDSGRLRGGLPYLSGAVFPYDEDARAKIGDWLTELEGGGMVRRYSCADGNSYIDIPKWLKHQKIEKPSPSKLPPFGEDSPTPPRSLPDSSPLDQGSGIRERRGGEGTDQSPVEDMFEGMQQAGPITTPDPMERTWMDWRTTIGRRCGFNKNDATEAYWISIYNQTGWDEMTKAYEYLASRLTDPKHKVWPNSLNELLVG